MLRVAVCAQHQNGGLWVDKNYQTNIDGLYAAGEAAGVFGVYRPGGSALNSTQVSSMRSAQHVAKLNRNEYMSLEENVKEFIKTFEFADECSVDFVSIQKELQKAMSDYAAFSRDKAEISALKEKVSALKKEKFAVCKKNIVQYLKFRDMLITMDEVLTAMLFWYDEIGSRGSAVCVSSDKVDTQGKMVCTQNGIAFSEVPPPIPQSEVWFEKVYNKNK